MEMMAESINVVQGPWRPPEPESKKLSLTEKKQMFQEAEDALEKARELAFRDADFFHNFDDNQWTREEKAKLSARGQPIYTHNRCKKKIQALKGMEQRSRTDPRAYPRKPGMEAMADVATDVLNALDDKTNFDVKASELFEGFTVEGIEAAEIVLDEDDEISVDDIGYEELFYDPRSKKLDFSDARYKGYAKWRDLDDAIRLYPDKEDELVATMDGSGAQTDYEDRPVSMWCSRAGGRKRVRIIVLYYKDNLNQWRLAHFAGNADLFDERSPWLDEKGKHICGLEMQARFKDRENRCYGDLRDMIGAQRELNHYRAKMWHHANNRRTYGADGAFKDIDQAKSELAKVDGHLEIRHGMEMGRDWGFIESSEDVAIYSNLLNMAASEIGVQSPNESLIGRQASSQSGRAGEVQRDAGMTEEHDVFDLHRQFKERVYRQMFLRARQFWREPDYLRVTEKEDQVRFIAINEPVTGMFGEQIGVRNNISQMDVDIIVKSMPEVATLQAEQHEQLGRVLPTLIQAPPAFAKLYLRTSQLRDKKELEDLLDQQAQPPQPDPMQQAAVQAELQDKQAGTRERNAKATKTELEAQAQHMKNQLGLFG